MLPYLEVKVSDLLGVQVEDSVQDLFEELRGLLFAQGLLFGQEVEKFAASHTGQRERGEGFECESSRTRAGHKSLLSGAELM